MRSSPNATSYVPPSTDISVYPIGPTQNRSVSLLKRVTNAFTNALLQPWSRARDHGGWQAHTECLILPGVRNHSSQTGGIPEYRSSTATALSTSEGPPTAAGFHKSSSSTCAQSTGRLTQSHVRFFLFPMLSPCRRPRADELRS